MARDNFTKDTITSLGKRVGFLCSNPDCGKHTSGPHSNPEKVIIIGEAAHIFAASPGGPRYNANMTMAERKSIENGIWLCSSCSDLIDKDWKSFPEKTLREWKDKAEKNMLANLIGSQKEEKAAITPFLEADLIWTGGSRAPRGYSNKNPISFVNGAAVRDVSSNPIIHWEIKWKYTLAIHNNSSVPAFNVSIESLGEAHFSVLEKLAKINNIPPFSSIEVKAEFFQRIEDNHSVADALMAKLIPDIGEGLILYIGYLDESRNSHITESRIIENQFINNKIK